MEAARSEELAAGPGRDAFAGVLARALAPPPVAAELCLPLCRPGGSVLLWDSGSHAARFFPAWSVLSRQFVPGAFDGLGKLVPNRLNRRAIDGRAVRVTLKSTPGRRIKQSVRENQIGDGRKVTCSRGPSC